MNIENDEPSHRMLGRPTLWVPGVDHAGIATQVLHCNRVVHSPMS